jgi:hypothetical protein
MLNADDSQTVFSLRALREIVLKGERPIVLWIGSGASKWAGYPLWDELATKMRADFFKSVPGFNHDKALRLLQSNKYPNFFQLCKTLDRARYFHFLANALSPKSPNDVHARFTELLERLPLLQIVTTNVDEMLERTIPSPVVIQKSDLTRIVELLNAKSAFIGKLHGSSSSIESTTFATEDYQAILEDSGFIAAVGHIFTCCSVLFLGYSVRDQYVVDLILRNATDMRLFGSGPHFLVTNGNAPQIPGLRTIKYSIKLHPDHRAALSVLDFLHESKQLTYLDQNEVAQVGKTMLPVCQHRDHGAKSIYFISDFKTPGTWHTSETAKAERPDGMKTEFTIGLGFTDDEIPDGDPFRASTAVHDLVVGLTCFDLVYLPIVAIGPLIKSFGEAVVRDIVNSDSLRLLHLLHQPAVIFDDQTPDIFGSVVSLTPRSKDGTTPQTSLELIQRSLTPIPGKEAEGNAFISRLEQQCVVVKQHEWELPTEVRGALLMPKVSTTLGVGDAILPSQVPRWLVFPYLRLAHLVHTAMICESLGIQAAKVPFGGATLVNGAFGVRIADELAESCASYVLAGNYNTDLGALVQQEPRVIHAILKFRDSQEGESLRREVGALLSTSRGAEFAASVNAGLKKSVPSQILQKAKDQLSFLLTNGTRAIPTPAVWGNVWHSDRATKFWRAKSKTILSQLCAERRISKDDPCICRSGEKLRLCCMQSLRN